LTTCKCLFGQGCHSAALGVQIDAVLFLQQQRDHLEVLVHQGRHLTEILLSGLKHIAINPFTHRHYLFHTHTVRLRDGLVRVFGLYCTYALLLRSEDDLRRVSMRRFTNHQQVETSGNDRADQENKRREEPPSLRILPFIGIIGIIAEALSCC
jgi:hypothetical protein